MELNQIKRILDNHCIENQVINNHIFATEYFTFKGELLCEYVDMTNWNISEIKNWLGY